MTNLILLCNYNEGKTGSLEKCLSALSRNKIDNTIISIIDNGSKDNSYEIIAKYQQNKTIDYAIFNTKNLGKAKALNILLKYLLTILENEHLDFTKTLVYSIDSDMELLQDNFIIKMVELFTENNNISVVGINYLTNGKVEQQCNLNNNNIKIFNNIEYFDVSNFDASEAGINKGFRGMGGAILVMPILKFIKAGCYNEHLGPNNTGALYGGDDGMLLLTLYKNFPTDLMLCTKTLSANHPPTLDNNYQNWKAEQIHLMCTNGFGNSKLAITGFF